MTKHTPGPWYRNVPPATKYVTIYNGQKGIKALRVSEAAEDAIYKKAMEGITLLSNHTRT